MSKHVFFVSSGRLAAYRWNAGRFATPLVFMADEEGLTQFSIYLQHAGTDPVYMLVDLVEEEFREDTVPHVFGSDRRALVRTKLNRLFRDATYSHAIFQGRESEGRRDDRVLFTALIRPDLLSPWVGQIARHRVPLAGIYSLPLITDRLLKPLQVTSDHALVVSLQSAGGLRQTFFHEQQLKLSRLAVMPQVERRTHASYVLGEIEKIRRYLNSLRMLPHDSPLDVHVLGDPALLEDIGRQSPDSITTRHHLHDLAELARRLGIKGEYGSRYADRIFAHVLARRPPPNQYAPEAQTRYFTLHQARNALRAASVALLVGSLGWGGYRLFDAVSAAQESASLEQQIAFYQERYRLAREDLPPTPADSRDLRQAVELVAAMAAHKTDPYPMLATVAEGLRPYPRLSLEVIDWTVSADPDAPVGSGGRRGGTMSALQNLLRGAPGAPSAADGNAKRYQIAHFRGEVAPFAGDYREALEMVRGLEERLRGLPGVVKVEVVSLPLDIGSEARLSGDARGVAETGDAPFEIRVVMEEAGRALG